METRRIWTTPRTAPGNELVRLKSAVVQSEITASTTLSIADPLVLEFECWLMADCGEVNFSIVLWTSARECAFNAISTVVSSTGGIFRGTCCLPAHLLNAETYTVDLYVVQDTSTIMYMHQELLTFETVEGARVGNWYGKWLGAVRPRLEFTLTKISPT
jgi:lipopolysaccharide transport system ATP-binding protein